MKKLLMFLFISIGMLQYANAQTVTGIITGSDDGEPLPGVNIQIKGTTTGTITDLEGKYTIEVSGEAPVLLFSFIGYTPKEVAVNGQTTIDVQLEVEATGIEEIIITGYGVQKKSLVTGSIAKVDGSEISRNPNLQVNQALQGKTAGVLITNNSGQPGSFVSVRIRGNGTNGDAEPLYIVDGLPMDGGGIDFINPSDVESVEVLKDAASASIYGARGANGVVLITTKTGNRNDKFQISYDGYYGVQNPWRKLDVLNKDEYVMIMNEASLNAGQGIFFDQARIDTLANTDWQDEMFFYNAPKINHVLSFTGGSEKTTYSSSLSYYGQDGIVAKGQSNYKRITYRLNVTRKFGMLEVGSNLNFANIQTKGIAANDKYAGNSLIQALNTPPIVPVYNADGTFATPTEYGVGIQEITNPVAVLSYQNNETKTNKGIGNVYAEFDFGDLFLVLKGLKFRTSFGGEITYVGNRGYTPKYYIDNLHQATASTVSTGMDKYGRWNFENVLTYTKSIGEHNFTALIGHTAFKNWHDNIGGSQQDFIFDSFEYAYINNTTNKEEAIVYGGYSEHTLLSYFGRVNYDFSNKYMLSAVLRADGSSRFGAENKVGYFPSVSAGWNLTREDFMSFLDPIISYAKIRASWGQNGNENIGDFGYTSVMGNGAVYFFGTNGIKYNGMQPKKLANPSLRWETSEQTDIGLDLGFLKNKFTLNMDYYIKTTKDWLVDAPAPALVGNVPPTINGGTVKNTGFETEIGYNDNFGGFHLDISLTGTYNKNEVIEIRNEEKRLQGGDGGHGQSGILYAAEGTSLGVFYAIKTDGIFQNQPEVDAYTNSEGGLIQENAKPGDLRFVDFNNDGKIDDEDRQVVGNPYPDFSAGLNFSLSWKGIDFNMFWYTALGHQVWNATRRYDLLYTNYRSDVLNRWTGEGTSTTYPRVTFTDDNSNMKTTSDFYIEDADYLRLKNISIGYTIPENLIKVAKISKLRIYVSAENLLTFTKYSGYDPEIGGGVFSNGIDYGIYPQARTILGGINITF